MKAKHKNCIGYNSHKKYKQKRFKVIAWGLELEDK